MNVATNGVFAVAIIPECRAYSVSEWAHRNNLLITDKVNASMHFYLPYRNGYDRIIRGIAADLQELMLNAGVADLTKERWVDVEQTAMTFIQDWIDRNDSLPIQKPYCHSGFYTAYVNTDIIKNYTMFDESEIDKLPELLNQTYGVTLVESIPKLPLGFYDNSVPYWVIDKWYRRSARLARMIDSYIERDKERSDSYGLTVSNLLVNAEVA